MTIDQWCKRQSDVEGRSFQAHYMNSLTVTVHGLFCASATSLLKYSIRMVWYGIVEFNVPLDTV